MSINPESSKWDEFRWENEIRLEEKRISCYFRELPKYIGLPGEEEIIFANMKAQGGLVPSGSGPGGWQFWDASQSDGFFDSGDDDGAEDDFGEFGAPPSMTAGEAVVSRVHRIYIWWNYIYSFKLTSDCNVAGLAISCAIGKAVARISDFYEVDPVNYAGLKICLGKRALRDISDLQARFAEVEDWKLRRAVHKFIIVRLKQYVGMLLDIRSEITSEMSRVREAR